MCVFLCVKKYFDIVFEIIEKWKDFKNGTNAQKNVMHKLDQILFDRKLVDSKSKAQAMIMAGQVYVEGKIINKSGYSTRPDSLIEIKNLKPDWVSRGAIKLIKALDGNNINVDKWYGYRTKHL